VRRAKLDELICDLDTFDFRNGTLLDYQAK